MIPVLIVPVCVLISCSDLDKVSCPLSSLFCKQKIYYFYLVTA